MKKYKNNYCIVGLGNHAISKLIPAINSSQGNLVSIVTKKKVNFNNIKTFKNLKIALKNMDSDTIIILCAPPQIRANQIIQCLENSFSVISEKPIFTNLNKLEIAYSLIKRKKLFLFENYMYLFSHTFSKFHLFFSKYKKKITKIKINFIIPNFPKNSFRSEQTTEKNIIYDMACYPISLINTLQIKINSIKIKRNIRKKNQLCFIINSDHFLFEINIGLGIQYQNFLRIYLESFKFDSVKYNYFFYGIEKKKKISFFKNKKKVDEITYLDLNSFVKIFNFPLYELYNLRNRYVFSKKNTILMNDFYDLINSSN